MFDSLYLSKDLEGLKKKMITIQNMQQSYVLFYEVFLKGCRNVIFPPPEYWLDSALFYHH